MSVLGQDLPGPIRVLARPRLRGWLHVWASLISIGAGAALVAVAAATRGARPGAATAVYALTVSLLFGTSALYHRIDWSPAKQAVMARLDHSMIFVFIAGTYTPFAVLSLPSRTGRVVLVVVWIGALAGLIMRSTWPSAPRWLAVPLYLGLGWVAVFVLPDLLRHGGVAAFVLLITGGLLYTFGAIVYGLQRPDPAPQVFGFHEVFHLCTVLAAVCHYIAVWLIIY
ncbi:MAG: hemolysin [Mycobacteriales bacterium]|jgi:hemolysin III